MEDFINNNVQPLFNYWAYVVIMMIGLWGLIAKKNFIKKLIGMSIFQTAIILLYVSLGYKGINSTIPIEQPAYTAEYQEYKKNKAQKTKSGSAEKKGEKKKIQKYEAIDPDKYSNPLPHVLMLTAIVVGVATLGVALAISQLIFKEFGTLEEPEILEKLKSGDFIRHD